MIDSKSFIIDKLKQLFLDIDDVKIRYEYREYLEAHFIEVLPLDTFEKNQDFILIEMEIQNEFETMYGENEDILFISSDSLNKIEDVQFSLGYSITETILLPKLISNTFSFSHIEDMITVEDTSYALAA